MISHPRASCDLRLYLVLDPIVVRGHSIEKLIEEAVAGGVTIVQVREKYCSNEDFLSLAWKASRVLRRLGIPLIINDRVDIAAEVGAQGVHVGQSDLPWQEARRLLGPKAIVGISVENLEQAEFLRRADVDYLGVSSIFPSKTKVDATPWGLDQLARLRERSKLPLVGIGGIDLHNAPSVLHAGADGIALVSAICADANPRKVAKDLRLLVEQKTREKK